jgi:hypothetical protein
VASREILACAALRARAISASRQLRYWSSVAMPGYVDQSIIQQYWDGGYWTPDGKEIVSPQIGVGMPFSVSFRMLMVANRVLCLLKSQN